MRDGISLATVPGQGQADSRQAQLTRATARSGPQAGEVPLRAQHFLLGGELVAFVDIDGSEETGVAEVAATLAAIGQAVGR